MEKEHGGGLRAIPEVDERRQHQRIEPDGATVEAEVAGQMVTFPIENLSEGGAFIAGRIEIAQGASCDLKVALPGIAPIVLPARIIRHVARAQGDGTAVMFLSASEVLTHWISDIVLQGLRAAFPEL